MLYLAAAMCLGVLQDSPSETLTKEAALQLITTLQSTLHDFACEFEGKMLAGGETGSDAVPGTVHAMYEGKFTYRDDDNLFLELFLTTLPKHEVHRLTIATKAGITSQYSRTVDRPGDRGQKSKATREEYDREGSIGRVFLWPSLKAWLLYGNASLKTLAQEKIEGNECMVLEFCFTNNPKVQQQRFWIDLHRGGQVLKRAIYDEFGLSALYTDIKLEEVRQQAEASAWVPTSGVLEVYRGLDPKGNRVFSKSPVLREVIAIKLGTLKCNRSPSDKEFEIKFPAGARITDDIRRRQYDSGRDERPPPSTAADAEQRLQALLSESEKQTDELRAPRWSVDGDGFLIVWGPWILTLICFFGAGFLLWIRRSSGT